MLFCSVMYLARATTTSGISACHHNTEFGIYIFWLNSRNMAVYNIHQFWLYFVHAGCQWERNVFYLLTPLLWHRLRSNIGIVYCPISTSKWCELSLNLLRACLCFGSSMGPRLWSSVQSVLRCPRLRVLFRIVDISKDHITAGLLGLQLHYTSKRRWDPSISLSLIPEYPKRSNDHHPSEMGEETHSR